MRIRTLLLSVLLATSLAHVDQRAAHAGGKKKPAKAAKGGKAKAPVAKAANAKAVTELMGAFKWGMTIEQVYGVLGKQIDEKTAEKIKTTGDILEQNKFRKEAALEKSKLKEGYYVFDGKPQSWDVSIIDREFDHKNEETMLVIWEKDAAGGKDQRRFFFFVDGKLWKMFTEFNAEMFEDKTFDDFKKIMEERYGPGVVAMRTLPDGSKEQDSVQWRGGGAFLRAIDLTKFYSSFCIAISDDSVEQWIWKRREERSPKKKGGTPMADSVSEDPSKKGVGPPPEDNADVVKDITKGQKKDK